MYIYQNTQARQLHNVVDMCKMPAWSWATHSEQKVWPHSVYTEISGPFSWHAIIHIHKRSITQPKAGPAGRSRRAGCPPRQKAVPYAAGHSSSHLQLLDRDLCGACRIRAARRAQPECCDEPESVCRSPSKRWWDLDMFQKLVADG